MATQVQLHRSNKIVGCSNCVSCFPGVASEMKDDSTKGSLILGNITEKPQILVLVGGTMPTVETMGLLKLMKNPEAQSSEGLKTIQEAMFDSSVHSRFLRGLLKKRLPTPGSETFLDEALVMYSVKCRVLPSSDEIVSNMNMSCSVWTKQMVSTLNLSGIICFGDDALQQLLGFTGDSPIEQYQMKKHPLYGPVLLLPPLEECHITEETGTVSVPVIVEFYQKVSK